ncbi:MAG: prepilin-type N-terminal cleavage/methylation domain-containing protein [Candidatus Omnitrophota bacterium]
MSLFIFNKKGMTLVESLVAMLILLFVITGMLSAFVVGKMSIYRTGNRAKAMNLLREQMELIKAQDLSTIEGWIDDPFPPEDDVDDAVGGDDLIDDTRTTTVQQDADGNLIVTVTLNWAKKSWGGTLTKGTADDPDMKLETLISPQ